MVTSGLRIGTPALASRGFQVEDFVEVADIIATVLRDAAAGTDVDVEAAKARVAKLTQKFPLYPGLDQ